MAAATFEEGMASLEKGEEGMSALFGISKGPGEAPKQVKVSELFAFDALGRKSIEEAEAGEIVVFSGLSEFDIGDTLVDMADPQPLDPIAVEEPTMSVTMGVNKSPFAGKTGKQLTSRQIRE